MKLLRMLNVCKIQSLCVLGNFVGQTGGMSKKNGPSFYVICVGTFDIWRSSSEEMCLPNFKLTTASLISINYVLPSKYSSRRKFLEL
jgi:hypothetical protein